MLEHVFVSHIGGILKDNSYDRFVGKRTRGGLDTKGLHRADTNQRVFKQKLARKNKKYDCTILVDCSGSMHSFMGEDENGRDFHRYDIANESAQILHRSMVKAGIPTQVIGFNSIIFPVIEFEDGKLDDHQYRKVKQYLRDSVIGYRNGAVGFYDKLNDVYYGVGPQWKRLESIYRKGGESEVRKELKINYHDLNIGGGAGSNNDALAVMYAQHTVEKREGKHIIIVLSDGEPAPDRYTYAPFKGDKKINSRDNDDGQKFDLKKVVARAIKDEILFVGIGIENNNITRYYPDKFCSVIKAKSGRTNIRSQEGNVLFQAVITQLKKHIQRG